MRPSVKRVLRIVLGFILGALAGAVLSACVLGLAFFVCVQDADPNVRYAPAPRHDWVNALVVVMTIIAAILPLVTGILGVIWARRQNRWLYGADARLRVEQIPNPPTMAE